MSTASKLDQYESSRLDSSDYGSEVYRAISKAAVTSAALAFVGILAFWTPIFVLLPFMAICFGVVSLLNIRRLPDELVGKGVAVFGIVLGGVVFLGAIALNAYVYATEVPEGYNRLLFFELKPNVRSNQLFTEKAEQLDGQKIFIKGYVRPGLETRGLSKFILTGDYGDCCFGGNPKINEIIGVRITTDQTVDYDRRLRNIIGTFRLNRTPKIVNEKDVPQIIYEIEAEEIR